MKFCTSASLWSILIDEYTFDPLNYGPISIWVDGFIPDDVNENEIAEWRLDNE